MVETSSSSSGIARIVRSIVLGEKGDPGRCSTTAAPLVASTHPCQLRVPPCPGAALYVIACDSVFEVATDSQLSRRLEALVFLGSRPSTSGANAEIVPGEAAKRTANLAYRDPAEKAELCWGAENFGGQRGVGAAGRSS